MNKTELQLLEEQEKKLALQLRELRKLIKHEKALAKWREKNKFIVDTD